MKPSRQTHLVRRFRALTWLLLLAWTGSVAGSLLWNLRQQRGHSLQMARLAARSTFENDVLYRRWAAQHGGVYVCASADTPPNPYLQVPDRDVTTTSGLALTLVNPAYMARQVNALAGVEPRTRGHLTSLKPLRPENAPDAWEAAALRAFEQGVREVDSVEQMADGPYVRLMRPFITEPSCLACHAAQGYREGDIRGGISVSVPLAPLQAIEKPLSDRLAAAHAGLWIIGLAGIGFSRRSLEREILGRERLTADLQREASDRQLAERRLFEAHQRLTALMNALPVGVSFSDDATSQRITGNPAVLAQFEVTPSDNLSASAPEPTAPGRQVRFFRDGLSITDADLPLQRAVAENRDIPPMTLEVRLPSGRRWFAAASGAPIRDQAGKVIGGVAVTMDITAQIEVEQALVHQREELQTILDSTPALIFYKDQENRFLRVNRALAESMGLPKEQLEGRSLFDLFPREQAEAYWKDDQEVLASGQPKRNIVEPMPTPAGERWMETDKVPCRDAQGELIGIIGFSLDVTERRRVAEVLRQREAGLRQALEAGQVFTFEWNPATDLVVRSPNCGSILGWESDATRDTGQGFFAAIHPDDRERFVRLVSNLTPQQPAYSTTYRYLRRDDGREVILEETGRAEFNGKGKMIGLRGLTRDVTEHRRAEDALRESEARLRLAQVSAGAGMWDWDLPTGKLEWSEGMFRLFGLEAKTAQASLEVWRGLLHPDERVLAEQRIQTALAQRTPLASEYRVVRPSGQIRWIHALGQATYDPAGEPRRMSGICLDITERKQAEERLGRFTAELEAANTSLLESRRAVLNLMEDALAARQRAEQISAELRHEMAQRQRAEEALRGSEFFYRQTIESIPGMVFTTRADGYCDYQSQQWVDFTGIPMTEHLGDGWNRLLHPDDQPRALAAWRDAAAGRAPYDLEYRVRRSDGAYEWFKVRGRPIRDEAGQVVRWFGTALNIEDLKQVEEHLKASLREKEVLLQEVHHRVKNNLQVISSLINLQADGLNQPALREALDDVRDRVRTMALVHEKLYQSGDLARLEFSDYATSLLHSLWRAHGDVAAKVRLTLTPEPIRLPVGVAVPCGLILNELASNALKHAFTGRASGDVTVGLSRAAATNRVCLRVSDNGVGLPAGQDWRQSRSLGLRLVLMLAQQLHGSVETSAGPGTEFRITFPAPEGT